MASAAEERGPCGFENEMGLKAMLQTLNEEFTADLYVEFPRFAGQGSAFGSSC
jgi:hypothetical protein